MKNSKVLHIILDQKSFTESIIPFIQKEFSDYNFTYCVFSKSKSGKFNTKIMDGVLYYFRKNLVYEIKLFKSLLEEYDTVFFHSLLISPFAKIFLSIYTKLIKKIVWIGWGYDLYLEKVDNSFHENIKYLIKKISSKLFDKQIPHFVAIHEVDLMQYDRSVSGHAIKHVIRYRTHNGHLPPEEDLKPIREKVKENEPICIQIGHRADPYLKHIDILNSLYRFKDRNIKLLIPLSYGDLNYGKTVANIAISLFGDKAQILSDFLPYSDYLKILQNVDIMILNSNRQIALGNIHLLFSFGKKVYLPSDSVLLQYFQKKSVSIYRIDDLKQCSYEQFILDADIESEREYMREYYNKDCVCLWRDLFKQVLYS